MKRAGLSPRRLLTRCLDPSHLHPNTDIYKKVVALALVGPKDVVARAREWAVTWMPCPCVRSTHLGLRMCVVSLAGLFGTAPVDEKCEAARGAFRADAFKLEGGVRYATGIKTSCRNQPTRGS